MDAIQPHNRPAFELLFQQASGKQEGATFTPQDWDEINRILGRPWPKWYQTLLQTYPLAGLTFYVPWKEKTPKGATCSILPAEALKDYCANDGFFVDDFYTQWLQFGEAFHFGGPGRWLIPIDESVEPIVHAFSDGDVGPVSTNLRFDDFLLTASLEPSREEEPPGAARIKQRLNEIFIPRADFENADVPTVFATIERLAKEYDPLHEGIQIEITPEAMAYRQKRLITASPPDRTLDDLLSLMTCLTNLAYKVTGKGVQIRSMFE